MYNFGIMDTSTKLNYLIVGLSLSQFFYTVVRFGDSKTLTIEAVQIRFYKSIRGLYGLNRNCSNVVVFGELGKLPMQILCKIRIFSHTQ